MWIKHKCHECGHTKKIQVTKLEFQHSQKSWLMCSKPGCIYCYNWDLEKYGYHVPRAEGELIHDPVNWPDKNTL